MSFCTKDSIQRLPWRLATVVSPAAWYRTQWSTKPSSLPSIAGPVSTDPSNLGYVGAVGWELGGNRFSKYPPFYKPLEGHIGRGTTPVPKRLLAIVANYLLTGALPLRKLKEQIHVPRPMMVQVSMRQISGGMFKSCSQVWMHLGQTEAEAKSSWWYYHCV